MSLQLNKIEHPLANTCDRNDLCAKQMVLKELDFKEKKEYINKETHKLSYKSPQPINNKPFHNF